MDGRRMRVKEKIRYVGGRGKVEGGRTKEEGNEHLAEQGTPWLRLKSCKMCRVLIIFLAQTPGSLQILPSSHE